MTALIPGLIQGGLSLAGSLTQGSAAKSAAQVQADAAQKGIDLQKQIFQQQQANQAPFMQAGVTSLNDLMGYINAGKFGPGAVGPAPAYTGGDFHAPTAAEAEATPGYQFTQQQGNKGILQAAAGAGGAISGGTLRAASAYNTGLADNTYNDSFNRALTSFNAGISKHQTDLATYGAALQGNQQEFQQLFAPAQLGENAVANIGQTGTAAGQSIAALLGGQGQALASGIVGSANATAGGLSSLGNSLSGAFNLAQLQQLLGPGGTAGGGGGVVSNMGLPSSSGGGSVLDMLNSLPKTMVGAPPVMAAPVGPG